MLYEVITFLLGHFRTAEVLNAYQKPLYANNNSLNPYVRPMCDTMSNDVTINYKCFSLWNRYYNKTKAGIDSVMIENFNCQAGLTPYTDPIAGVSYNPITRENISQARVWMRKSNIVRGNAYRYPTAITAAQAWTNSRGTSYNFV